MSRQTQLAGLTDSARNFIEQRGKFLENGDSVLGMFEEEAYILRKFQDSVTGANFEEFVQAEPWSSGPVIFIGLKWSYTGKPVQGMNWSQKDIDEA